ncbi:hypothetical protein MPLDJ20_220020 [Mesorhizobium plurifarium]|uniref:Uncharacterized protein n=1 Tax=Mesorhizobium plurifarium TaxID=69974 RepID=A0A090F2C6_MESPL|nr:hypothetical protein MPLDJ20_220020 [Mesorhizobium plurifarium]
MLYHAAVHTTRDMTVLTAASISAAYQVIAPKVQRHRDQLAPKPNVCTGESTSTSRLDGLGMRD